MKRIICLLLVMLGLNTYAQQRYNFSQLTETYSDLNGLTLFGNGQVWNNTSLDWGFQLPFPVNVAGVNYSFFIFDGSKIELFAMNGSMAQLHAHGIYINDKSTSSSGTSISPVGYKTEGTPGNRIVKIQFKNVGSSIEYLAYNTRNITMNFQIWLYESSNIIEYRMGTNNVNNHLPTLQEPIIFGISRETGNSFVSVLYGSHTNISHGEYADPEQVTPDNYTMSSYPVAHTVYRFTPTASASTPQFTDKGFAIYPNPVSDVLHIDFNEFVLSSINSIEVFDLSGRRLIQTSNQLGQIFVGDLAKGNYVLKIHTDKGVHISKFIKK